MPSENESAPLNLEDLRYEPLSGRPSKVALSDLGRPCAAGISLDDWIERLPRQLAGNSFRKLVDSIVESRKNGRPVLAALGGHVVKTGCGPYLIDWIERGLLNGLAMNGAAAIHDLELAVAGHTSEEVGPRLIEGSFGFAAETSDLFAKACRHAHSRSIGLGRALGDVVLDNGGPGLDSSLLVAARRAEIPLTVHVAIGSDIVHMTPRLDGESLGAACLKDFRIVCDQVAGLAGGVWLNLGSAVILPEVFLKAVAVARNLGRSLEGMTTANLDFQQQYRGLLNVLRRPGSEGIGLTGHHELLIPLLHAATVQKLGSPTPSRPRPRCSAV